MSVEMEKSYNVLLSILDTLHRCIIITAPAITFIPMHSHRHMAMGSQGPTYSKSGPWQTLHQACMCMPGYFHYLQGS